MKPPVVSTKKLGLKIGRQYLLKDINWEIYPKEHWIVFGMNGSGKTTLLSIIAGYRAFNNGDLKIFGENYTNETILALRKQIGWVSSSFFDHYYSHENVLDIVLSGLTGTFSNRGQWTDKEFIQAKALLANLGIGSKTYRAFSSLSKGERQNVLLARALLPKPRLLILDEACSGLDIYARAYLLDTLKYIANETDITMIQVTHQVEEITDVFSNCLLLKMGLQFAAGKIEDIFRKEVLEKFLNYPVTVTHEVDWKISMCVKSQFANVYALTEKYSY